MRLRMRTGTTDRPPLRATGVLAVGWRVGLMVAVGIVPAITTTRAQRTATTTTANTNAASQTAGTAGTAVLASSCDDSKCRAVNATNTPSGTPGYWWLPLPLPTEFAGGYTCWAATTNNNGPTGDAGDTATTTTANTTTSVDARTTDNGDQIDDTTTTSTLLDERYPCADGYYGRPVPASSNSNNNNNKDNNNDDSSRGTRYTCCPIADADEDAQDKNNNNNENNSNNNNKDDALDDSYDVNGCRDWACSKYAYSCWAAPDGIAPRRCIDDEYSVEGGPDNGTTGYVYPRDTGAFIPIDFNGNRYHITQFLCCKTPQVQPPSTTQLDDGDETDLGDHNNNNSGGGGSHSGDANDGVDSDGDLLRDGCSVDACTSLADDCWADAITEPFSCDTRDPSNPYIYPTVDGHDDPHLFNFHYVCCNHADGYYYYRGAEKWRGVRAVLAIQSAIAAITFVVTFVFTCALLSNRKVRNQGWNLYLVMLSIPDVFYNIFRFSYGMMVLAHYSTTLQSTFPIDWYYAVANLLLNAVIVYEVHKFLRSIRRHSLVRVAPPTTRKVLIQAFVVYAIGAACGIWMFYLHVKGNVISGYNDHRWKVIHAASLCCMIIPPVFFVFGTWFDIWYRQLLPSSAGESKTRTLAIYFLRVIFAFFVIWIPFLVITAIGKNSNRYYGYVGYGLASIQGTLSVIVAMTKPDIHWAVKSFLLGKCNAPQPIGHSVRSSSKGQIRISGNFLAGSSRDARALSPGDRSNNISGSDKQLCNESAEQEIVFSSGCTKSDRLSKSVQFDNSSSNLEYGGGGVGSGIDRSSVDVRFDSSSSRPSSMKITETETNIDDIADDTEQQYRGHFDQDGNGHV